MIPKTIHYCWFGRGEKPKLVRMCMATWKKKLADYDIVEWNEDNFDIHINTFVRQAYENKNYAFVSDYARAFALYNYGGIYLDTDVEVLKNFDGFLGSCQFAGFEEGNYIGTCVIGAEKGSPIIKNYMEHYDNTPYVLEDGSKYTSTNVVLLTILCEKRGLVRNNEYQVFEGFAVYPRTFFSPYDYINGANYITEDSHAIHHFARLWLPKKVRLKSNIKRRAVKVIGAKNMAKIRGYLK